MTTPDGQAMPSLAELIDRTEASINRTAQQQLQDPVVLEGLAQSWRSWVAGLAAMPAELRGLARSVELFRGGPGYPGGLGDDYPSGLLGFVRTMWITSARTLAMQQGLMPYGVDESRRLHQLASTLEAARQPAFAPTPCAIVHQTAEYRLRAVAPDGASGEPILVVSSLINRWYILDFQVEQSFIAMLRGFGRPVYLLEWWAPRVDDDRGLGELAAGPVVEATDWIRTHHDVNAIAMVGYSMGGTIAACLASRYPERISRLATVCSPIDFARGGSFTQWLSSKFVDIDLVTSAWNRVPAELVHAPFWWLRPSIKLHKLALLARAFERPNYVEQFLATEVWNHDNVELSRGVFRSWVGELYQRNALVNGTMVVGGEAVHPSRIACPVLIVSGTGDTIVPPEAAEGLAELCAPGVARVLRVESGHVGVLTSRRALALQATEFKTWLEAPLPAKRTQRRSEAS
ncbi:MAG: alpha/beta fold hydrolase [Kofleriaceae bacterium]